MGGLKIFRRKYTVRRFGPQEDVPGGYTTAPYEDVVTFLNVQPLSTKELLALPEGERSTKRVKAFGDLQLTAADSTRASLETGCFTVGRGTNAYRRSRGTIRCWPIAGPSSSSSRKGSCRTT